MFGDRAESVWMVAFGDRVWVVPEGVTETGAGTTSNSDVAAPAVAAVVSGAMTRSASRARSGRTAPPTKVAGPSSSDRVRFGANYRSELGEK